MPILPLIAGAAKVLAPIAGAAVAGMIGSGGQAATNKANQASARERMNFEDAQAQRQMSFQERMSSTAAQRAVGDYRAAGLNPALAYGTTAQSASGASGGGAQSVAGDVAGAGMSSARAFQATQQALRINAQQSDADLALKSAHTAEAQIRARTAEEQGALYRAQMVNIGQQTLFNSQSQPANIRKAFADAVLSELAIPSARNDAALSTRLGEFRPAIGTLFSGARAVGEFTRLIPRFR